MTHIIVTRFVIAFMLINFSSFAYAIESGNMLEQDADVIKIVRNIALSSYKGEQIATVQNLDFVSSVYSDHNMIAADIYLYNRIYIVGCRSSAGLSPLVGNEVTARTLFGVEGKVKKHYEQLVNQSKEDLLIKIRNRVIDSQRMSNLAYDETLPAASTHQRFHENNDVIFTGMFDASEYASLAALYVVRQNLVEKAKVKLVTFSPTKIGDKDFAFAYKDSIPLLNTVAFMSPNDFPYGEKRMHDYGKVGLPVRITAEESWNDLSNKKWTMVGQGATIFCGITIGALLGSVSSVVTIPVSLYAAHKLPAITGAEPYGAPSETSVVKAFNDLKRNYRCRNPHAGLEVIGERV